jgi:hypothetical protein
MEVLVQRNWQSMPLFRHANQVHSIALWFSPDIQTGQTCCGDYNILCQMRQN